MRAEQIARVAHQVNKAYCESIGDTSQQSWESAPEWQKQSAINGVNYHQTHLDSKPSDSHDSWLKEKIDSGWKYGPVKDPEKKEHPCCVPYEDLPVQQKTKDFLFMAIVKELSEELPAS